MFRLVSNDNKAFLDAFYKMITPNKVYKINFDIKTAVSSLATMESKMKSVEKYLSDVSDLSEYLDKISKMESITDMRNDFVLKDMNDNFTRFDTFNIKLPEDKNFTISGKQLVDDIREIHRIGGRLTPVLRRLMNQIKRLNTKKIDEFKIEEFPQEQQRNLKKMMNMFRYVYTYYNTLNTFIIQFRRKKADMDDVTEELTMRKRSE